MKLNGDRCQCRAAGCGLYFNSTYAFDKHRKGDYGNFGSNRYCLTADQLREAGWSQNAKGFWFSPRRGNGNPSVIRRAPGGDRAGGDTVVAGGGISGSGLALAQARS